MARTNVNFDLPAGDTRTLHIPLEDENGQPVVVPISATARWWFAKRSGLAANDPGVFKKDAASGVSFSHGPTQSTVVIQMLEADTDTLTGDYYHECEVRALGAVITTTTGRMRITRTLVR